MYMRCIWFVYGLYMVCICFLYGGDRVRLPLYEKSVKSIKTGRLQPTGIQLMKGFGRYLLSFVKKK